MKNASLMNGSAGISERLRFFAKASIMVLATLFLLVFASQHSWAQGASSQPAQVLSNRVVDDAEILDPETRVKLIQHLADFEKESSDEIVVVTVPSLGGQDIESYSNQLFRAWRLGKKQENNGILLVVAPNDRKVRIEVGYGLEGTMTDALSSVIINGTIIPEFRDGNFSSGVEQGVEGIISVLKGEGEELEARARRNAEQGIDDEDWVEFIFILFWLAILFGGFGFAVLTPIFGKKIGPGRYKWLGVVIDTNSHGGSSGGDGTSGWGGSSGGGWSPGDGGFSGGGGSSGGGGASGSW